MRENKQTHPVIFRVVVERELAMGHNFWFPLLSCEEPCRLHGSCVRSDLHLDQCMRSDHLLSINANCWTNFCSPWLEMIMSTGEMMGRSIFFYCLLWAGVDCPENERVYIWSE